MCKFRLTAFSDPLFASGTGEIREISVCPGFRIGAPDPFVSFFPAPLFRLLPNHFRETMPRWYVGQREA
jgi:hypothetical protein